MKLLIALTNRSSYNKVKSIVEHLLIYPQMEIEFLVGGSLYLYKYGRGIDFIEKDFPDIEKHEVALAVEGDRVNKMPKTIGLGAIEMSTIVDDAEPDAILTVADRHETLSTAIVAACNNIPLIHIQGGEISGSIDNKIRNAVTQLADYHFPATEHAKRNVLDMKPRDTQRVKAFGCPSMDLLKRGEPHCHNEINFSGIGDQIDIQKPYIIVMFHSDTNDVTASEEWARVLAEIILDVELQRVIFWNNIDPGGELISKSWRKSPHSIYPTRFIKHIEPETFGSLMLHAKCIVGNSSAGIRESSFIGVPSVNIGKRQDRREQAMNTVNVSKPEDLEAVIKSQIKYGKYTESSLYGDGSAGLRIGREIYSIMGNMINARRVGRILE